MAVKWSKSDVIKKFQEALSPQQVTQGTLPNLAEAIKKIVARGIKG